MGSAKLLRIAALKVAQGIVPAAGSITNAMLAGSIAYSKLTLAGAIVGGDLAANISISSSGGIIGATVQATSFFVGPTNGNSGVSKTLAQSVADGDSVEGGIIYHPL